MVWMETDSAQNVRTFAEDNMAAEAFGRARNYS